MRARELGIAIGSWPTGPNNAITDVAPVRVGHADVREPAGALTGVTVVVPHAPSDPLWRPVFAGAHVLSGNGELTGLEWLRESGTLTTPIALTNTFSVGTVRDALIKIVRGSGPDPPDWSLPVVGETYDGVLSDIEGMHVRAEHVSAAMAAASGGPVVEGCVGAGSGTICHGFKGGIGTASRIVGDGPESWCVGVLVQANQGRRGRLTILGAPVGKRITDAVVPVPAAPPGRGSVIVVIATDAPLLPHQCADLARRASLGVGLVGGTGESDSGDLLIAFATGNRLDPDGAASSLRALAPGALDPLYDGAIEATEEAIVNALLAATSTARSDGLTAFALDPGLLMAALEGPIS